MMVSLKKVLGLRREKERELPRNATWEERFKFGFEVLESKRKVFIDRFTRPPYTEIWNGQPKK